MALNYKQSLVEFLVRKDCDQFLSRLLLHLYAISGELDFGEWCEAELECAEDASNSSQKKTMNVLSLCLYMSNILAQSSLQFMQNMTKSQGVRAHFLFLRDAAFIAKHASSQVCLWAKRRLGIVDYLVMNGIKALSILDV